MCGVSGHAFSATKKPRSHIAPFTANTYKKALTRQGFFISMVMA